jgi:hypothetical protein
MKVLIACEESQAVCKAFRSLGHEAYSCDIQECSGEHPEWHIQGDAIEVAYGQDWDMMIAHPPCTYLAVSGARWMYHPDDKDLPFEDRRPHPKHPHRRQQQAEAMEFVLKLSSTPIPRIAIENPVSVISSKWRKPDQIIQPWQFGHEATKSTCLWLKGLPLLEPTDIVGKGERVVFKSGKSHPAWYAEAFNKARTREDRSKMRSKTFEGIATAMAEQWGNL